jgi:hypothetical protein
MEIRKTGTEGTGSGKKESGIACRAGASHLLHQELRNGLLVRLPGK